MSRGVWFQLVKREGNTIGSVSFVECAENAMVARLRNTIKKKYMDSLLAGIATSELIVFANRSAYDTKQALEVDSLIGPLGASKKDALIVQLPTQRRVMIYEGPVQKKTSMVILDEQMISIEHNLDIETWQVGGIALEICRIELDFPEWFCVRKETIDIIKVFEAHMKGKMRTLFVGTPGVGKSMLVVLFAFYMALIQKKRVVLFRKQHGKGFSLLYLNAEKRIFWRMDDAEIKDLYLHWNEFLGAELCLGGLQYSDIKSHFAVLGGFRILATTDPYPIKDGDRGVLSECLVPFWSLSDLYAIGMHHQWPEYENKDRYFYSGGNLRAFLLGQDHAETMVDDAIRQVVLNDAELFNTLHGGASVSQFDRIRMTGIQANDHRNLEKYWFFTHWISVITSEYALRQFGKHIEPSYYEGLWSKGHKLGDERLMDIAFENYVHTLARDGKKIELQVREYDRGKVSQHTYFALEIEIKSCRNDGVDATECDAAIKRFANSNDDYWYPSCRSLKTIDSVAKLNVDEHPDTIDLIQITISNKHKIDPTAIEKYAGFFPDSCRYIALLPSKELCDNFRLVPAIPDIKVPLYVAYITTGVFDVRM